MSVEQYYKSYGFKLINKDVFFSTLSVFILLLILPYFFVGPLAPIREAISDFNISDVYFSTILPELDNPRETDIVIVNTGIRTKNKGVVELNDIQYAKVVAAVSEDFPAVIGLNHKFTINEEHPNFEAARGIFSEANVIFAQDIGEDNPLYEGFETGFREVVFGKSKKSVSIRRFPPKKDSLLNYGVKISEAFNPDAVERFLARGSKEETINFTGNWDKYDIIDARQVFTGDFEVGYFEDRIVLFGVVDTVGASLEFDRMYYTPMNETTAGRTFPDIYEVVLHANIVSMLLTDEYYYTSPVWLAPLVAFIICYFNMILFGYVGYRNAKWYEIVALCVFVVESIGVALLTVHLFHNYKIELDLTMTIIAAAASIPVFELYTDTFKPALLTIWFKVFPSKSAGVSSYSDFQ